MSDVYLHQFEVIQPRHQVPQDKIVEWLIQNHLNAECIATESSKRTEDAAVIQKIFQKYAVKESQIATRFLESDDVISFGQASACVYTVSKHNPRGSDIAQRTQFFSERAYSIFQKIYERKQLEQKPDHMIHVTCTGYASPSAPQRIVSRAEWKKVTEITHAYHMGCYAAMPAVRIAQGILNCGTHIHPDYKVDIVHTEMCSLHLNSLLHTPEQVIVQTLFADGHVKYTLSSQKSTQRQSLRLITVLERIVPDSEEDMGWSPASWGMQMNLSREVPRKIKSELKKFYSDLLEKAGVALVDSRKGVFAIHPGGPKVIDAVQEVLELSDDQVAHSKFILFKRGNMSSATLPHVWSEVLERCYAPGTLVLSFAFGPGLTLFGSVFEVCE